MNALPLPISVNSAHVPFGRVVPSRDVVKETLIFLYAFTETLSAPNVWGVCHPTAGVLQFNEVLTLSAWR